MCLRSAPLDPTVGRVLGHERRSVTATVLRRSGPSVLGWVVPPLAAPLCYGPPARSVVVRGSDQNDARLAVRRHANALRQVGGVCTHSFQSACREPGGTKTYLSDRLGPPPGPRSLAHHTVVH
jgi:hypothetical protein